jgi:anti-sigma B factor antagonist
VPASNERRAFSVEVSSDGDHVVASLRGELDLASSEEALADITRGIGNRRSCVLDLSDLTFADSMGMSVFVAVDKLAKERGGVCTLRNPGRQVMTVIKILGLDAVLTIEAMGDQE